MFNKLTNWFKRILKINFGSTEVEQKISDLRRKIWELENELLEKNKNKKLEQEKEDFQKDFSVELKKVKTIMEKTTKPITDKNRLSEMLTYGAKSINEVKKPIFDYSPEIVNEHNSLIKNIKNSKTSKELIFEENENTKLLLKNKMDLIGQFTNSKKIPRKIKNDPRLKTKTHE